MKIVQQINVYEDVVEHCHLKIWGTVCLIVTTAH